MNDADKKKREEELRQKIREQLQREHAEKQQSQPGQPAVDEPTVPVMDESFYIQNHLRRKLEDEIYSRHPEFVKCENHLGQIKWFTPVELEREFEFFPVDENFWDRLKDRIFNRPVVKIPDTDEIKTLVQNLRAELEEDARERVHSYSEFIKTNKREAHDELERTIIEEEQDLFYSRLKGYHKYKNHIGETVWLTVNEFESQDEYIDRAYSKRELVVRKTIIGLGAMAFIALLYLGIGLLQPPPSLGFVQVDLGGKKGSLYIDHNLAVGFTPNIPYPLEEGSHTLRIISSGFISLPDTQTVVSVTGDTSRISFSLEPLAGDYGYVQIKAPYQDAAIYADGDFKGAVRDNDYLPLNPGDHTLTLKMNGYNTVPSLQTFTIHKGDTIDVAFRMNNARRFGGATVTTGNLHTGLIEVTSNISGAKIYLNGRPTGFETGYVLQKIPFGRYVVRVEKENYKVYPNEQIVTISNDNRNARADFTLNGTTRLVTLQTKPEDGIIFIDKKEAGHGKITVSLSIGSHKISFGKLPGYGTPEPQIVNVLPIGKNHFSFSYITQIHYVIAPGQKISTNGNLYVNYGYIMNGIEFKKSAINAPEIIDNSTLNQKVWHMGFAFRHQNPPGKDALAVYFRMPDELNLAQNITLKLWIYRSGDKYPLVIGGTSSYQVILNNAIVAARKKVVLKAAETSPRKYDAIPINRYLKPGLNVLLLSVSDENSVFIDLQKIVIE